MFFSEIRVGADYMEVERSLKTELFFVGLHANILVQSCERVSFVKRIFVLGARR